MKAVGLGILVATRVLSGHAGTLAVCDEPALRAALAQGGHVVFQCSGTITLSNALTITTNCVIDASGYDVTLHGGNRVRVFHVAPGVELTLLNLAITGGRWSSGGGIYNAGKLTVGNCRIIGNVANGYGVGTVGGGIYNVGELLITDSLIGTNMVVGVPGPPGAHGTPAIDIVDQYGRCRTTTPPTAGGSGMAGGPASGGGLFNSGTATIIRTTFANNGSFGGAGGDGGNNGRGGCTSGCVGTGGSGGEGGSATGGGIASGGSLTISDSVLLNNEARAGTGGRGGSDNCLFFAAPRGANGGEAEGGGLANLGIVSAWNVTVSGNIVRGGNGGLGGGWNPLVDPTGCPRAGNGNGGNAHGGGVAARSTFNGTNLTIWNNRVEAGTATNALVTTWTNCPAIPGSNGLVFGASIAAVTGYMSLWNSIVGNLAVTNNVFGMYNGDHNLCSDASAVSLGAGNLNNVDPQLSPLTDNGGPTLTHAVRPGSVAIDAARNDICPAADQRGVARRQRGGCDIGAYEATFVTVAFAAAANYRVAFEWVPLAACRLQSSADLITWQPLETKVSDANGRVSFEVPRTTRQFFRITSP